RLGGAGRESDCREPGRSAGRAVAASSAGDAVVASPAAPPFSASASAGLDWEGATTLAARSIVTGWRGRRDGLPASVLSPAFGALSSSAAISFLAITCRLL